MVKFKPLSLLIALVTFVFAQSVSAVGFPDVPNTHYSAHNNLFPEVGTLGDMFTQGGGDWWIRYRHEDVDEDRGGTPLADRSPARRTPPSSRGRAPGDRTERA